MPRSYSAGSIVALPRLDSITVGRLIEALLTVAAAEEEAAKKEGLELPPSIAAARDEMAESREALQAELMKRQAGDGEESPQVRAADTIEDNAFRAVVAYLRAFALLPAERYPESAQAQEILDTVFSDGLGFITIKPEKEWEEANIRLGLLESRGFNPTIEALGGKPFLDELAFAHAQYGEVLGIKAVKEGQEAPAVRKSFEEAAASVRTYVLRVTGHVSKKDPRTAELAERLLVPLAEWKDEKPKAVKGAGKTKKNEPEPKAEPKPDA